MVIDPRHWLTPGNHSHHLNRFVRCGFVIIVIRTVLFWIPSVVLTSACFTDCYLPLVTIILRFWFLDTDFASWIFVRDIMQTPQLALRLRCVNCNIRIDTLRRHLVFELDTRIISKICEWNSSIIVRIYISTYYITIT